MRYFFTFVLIALSSSLLAQHVCPMVDYQRAQMSADPGFNARRAAVENFTRSQLHPSNKVVTGVAGGGGQAGGAEGGTSGAAGGSGTVPATIIIPVVVHVIYNSGAENISDEQISSQLDVLNRDYGKLNPDTAAIPSYYRGLSANIGIHFALASIDTNGNPTTGIVRRRTAVEAFTYDDAIKFSARGGDDGWNRDHYLNIWVGALVPGVQGYSSMPGSSRETDGVVVNYTSFGTKGTATAPFNLGRTATHEIGHWFNLIHVWGDSDCGDDQVDDTPKQQEATYGNPSGMVFSCGNTPYGNLYMDYMDFTDDIGMHLFTHGQRERMLTLFLPGGFRAALLEDGAALVAGTSTTANPVLPGAAEAAFLQFYPNPARDHVTIVPSVEIAGGELEVYNQVGQRVMLTNFNGSTQTMDMTRLSPGLYFVRLKGQTGVYKLVKM